MTAQVVIREGNRANPVDELGRVKAAIAQLVEREEQLRAALVARGPGEYEGDLFRATVSALTRETLDMTAVRAKLSAQFIRAHTRVTEVTTVRVVARVGVAAREAA